MIDEGAALSDALQLEHIKFGQLMSDAATKREEDIKALERKLASQGTLRSGGQLLAVTDIIFTAIEGVVEKVIEYREELAVRVPTLLAPANLLTLQSKLDQYIDGGVNGVRTRHSMQWARTGGGLSASQEAERRAYALKARVKQKLAALPLEARLGIHQSNKHLGTMVHISNSTISNLNLGNVVGDLNSSIQQLSTEGRNDLAEAVRKLTEAVGASEQMNDEVRKEVLEHLSIVSGEAVKPAGSRKMGPLKTSLEAVKSGVALGTQLLTLWQGVEHALKAAGVI